MTPTSIDNEPAVWRFDWFKVAVYAGATVFSLGCWFAAGRLLLAVVR